MSNHVDLLDELTQPITTDENTENTEQSEQTEENTENEQTESVATEPETPGPKYTHILETRPEGAQTDDLMTVAEFANTLTLRNIRNGQGAEGIVDKSNVYNATKAVRNPLPVVLVGDVAWIPWEAGEQAWDARPERGDGGGNAGSRLSDDDLLRRSADVRTRLNKLVAAHAVRATKIEQLQKLYDKRNTQLAERFAGLTPDALWAKVTEWESANEGQTAEISDDVTDNDNGTTGDGE